MATTITANEFLAALDEWKVDWEFYKDKADWLTHNRNGASSNTQVTLGGFGPLRGVVAHNTASTAQKGMVDYLYRGDPARSLPGPMCQAAILKTGKVVLLGWGTANHCGPGDPKTDARARANSLPLDGELTPTTVGTDRGTVQVNPFYLGFEMCHAGEGATSEQYRQAVLFTCACLSVMGGPEKGYGAGSVPMHREFTRNRSDPQGVAKGQFRRDVAKSLAAGPPQPPTPEEPEMQLTDKVPGTDMTVAQALARGGYAYDQIVHTGSIAQRLTRAEATNAALSAAVKALSASQGLDPVALDAMVQQAVDEALADLKIVQDDTP